MTNLEKAIAVMERVKSQESKTKRKLFDFQLFQGFMGEDLYPSQIPAHNTEEEILEHCGTTCCFVGWLAISPEFKHLGIRFNEYGGLDTGGCDITTILQEELVLSWTDIRGLIFNEFNYFRKESHEITAQDVIDKLKSFLPK